MKCFTTVIETERLLLRKFTVNDAEFILNLFNDPTFIKHIGDKKIKTIEEATQHIIDAPLKSYKENGYGPYVVVIKNTNQSAGVCGFYKREDFEYPDLGYALFPQFTGKGYAKEAALATIDYGLTKLKLNKILAISSPKNIPSITLLKKVGLLFQRDILYGKEKELTKLFST